MLLPLHSGSEESLVLLQSLVEGVVLEVHIATRDGGEGGEDDKPLVELYAQIASQSPTFINREVVDRGFAVWREELS